MAKREKRARKKRLTKKIESLLERAEKHRTKVETEKGNKDTTRRYWIKEAKGFEEQAKQAQEMLKKLEGKKAGNADTPEEAETTDSAEEQD